MLREVFGFGFAESASAGGSSEAACRQLAVRARRHVDAGRPRFRADRRERERLATRFFGALTEGDVDGLRSLLAGSDPDLPMMDAIRHAVVAVNDYRTDDLARLRQRMQLQHDNPALLANGILHYEEWQAVVAEFAAGRLGQAADDLLPQVIARSVFGAAYAGFMSWLADERGDLGPRLDGALRAMAEACQA